MSETRTFMLELHCEEIPARFLKRLLTNFFVEFNCNWAVAQGLLTLDRVPNVIEEGLLPAGQEFSPRKLCWRTSLPVIQPDQTETQAGPPQKMCVDVEGQPTQTGLKFAEKWGVDFGAVRFEQPAGKKEPCAVVTITKKGRPTVELLAEALPKLIASLHVPKAMRWGNSEFEFVRPIRNVLCLFGEEVVDFSVDGVRSSNTTWGHRLHHMTHPEAITIQRPEDYETTLETAGVVVSFDARKTRMDAQLHELAAKVSGRVVMDEELLNTLAEIVEFPKIVCGEFPANFLELPKEVLVTSLKEHQKSFCIENEKGELLPFFLTAANRADDPSGFVKAGNEWVLKARLYDARFFYAEDRKTKLEARLEKLKSLTFQRELGSYHEKAMRMAALAELLARSLQMDEAKSKEAGRLAKADLRTLMVGEFPELQGIMGGEYLRHEGASDAVWQAVKEHYRPAGQDDEIPSTDPGCVIALADKLDTVVGCFAVGIAPTGSKDPLALRRAGLGVVRILWKSGLNLGLRQAVDAAWNYVETKATRPKDEVMADLETFFKDRVVHQLELTGLPGPVRRSVLPATWDQKWAVLHDLKARCEALTQFSEDPRSASLGQSAKRIANILKDEAPSDSGDLSLLHQPEERHLAELLKGVEDERNPAQLLPRLASLAEPLEAFFTAVMVKCEDASLRAARLSLLSRLRQVFLRVADFSQWQ